MGSNYTNIVAGIVARLTSQLVPTYLKNVLDHEPASITGGNAPLVYTILKSFALVPPANQQMELNWEQALRLVIPYTANNDTAEQLVATIVPLILTALGTDLDAGGAIPDGQVMVTNATAGYLTMKSGALCRIVDFDLTITERVDFVWAL